MSHSSTFSGGEELHDLLCSLFDVASLRRHIQFGPVGNDIVAELPMEGSLSTLATNYILAAQRRGLIDLSFFKRLDDAYPKRKGDIDRVSRVVLNGRDLTRARPELIRKLLWAALPLAILGSTLAIWAATSGPEREEPQSPNQSEQSLAIITPPPPAKPSAVEEVVNIGPRVTACIIDCLGCSGLRQAYFVIDDGDTYIVRTEANSIEFFCPPRTMRLTVVLEIQDQRMAVSYKSAEADPGSDNSKISLQKEAFSNKVPKGFSPRSAKPIDSLWCDQERAELEGGCKIECPAGWQLSNGRCKRSKCEGGTVLKRGKCVSVCPNCQGFYKGECLTQYQLHDRGAYDTRIRDDDPLSLECL